jgi:ATP-dependent Zn protease
LHFEKCRTYNNFEFNEYLKGLIANGKLKEAIDLALKSANSSLDIDIKNRMIEISGSFNNNENELIRLSPSEYSRQKEIISHSFLTFLSDNELYGEIPQKIEKKENSTEKTKEPKKKSYLFYFVLVLVLIIVLVVALIFFPKIWEVIVAVSTAVALILGIIKTVVEIKKETQSA